MSKPRFVCFLGLLLLAAMSLAIPASATPTTFNLNVCDATGGCLGAATPYGTVTLYDDGSGNTIVNVQLLTTSTGFQGGLTGLTSFVWNIVGDPTSPKPTLDFTCTANENAQGNPACSSITNWETGSTLNYTTSPNADGAGTFDYGLDCNKVSGSTCNLSSLVFVVDGYGIASFIANSDGHHFAADVAFSNGESVNTGMITDGPSNPPPIPEPATLALFGTGLAGIAGIVRRRMKK